MRACVYKSDEVQAFICLPVLGNPASEKRAANSRAMEKMGAGYMENGREYDRVKENISAKSAKTWKNG